MLFRQRKAAAEEPAARGESGGADYLITKAGDEPAAQAEKRNQLDPLLFTQRDPHLKALEGEQMNDNRTVLSRGTVLNGTLEAKSTLEVYGTVKGPVRCDSDIKLFGEVEGDIHCGSLTASGASVKGNIECDVTAVIGNDSVVRGSIRSESITVSGEVVGNLTASGSIQLAETAVVAGDIETPVLEVGKGAIVRGKVCMDKAAPPEPAELPEAPAVYPELMEERPEEERALAAALEDDDI